MRKISPLSLVDCSLKKLVVLTFSTLQSYESFNNLNGKNCKREPSQKSLTQKRKHEYDSDNSFDNSLPRKRLRRKSHDGFDFDSQRNISEDNFVSKDDGFIHNCSIVDIVIILKNHFKCLPQNLWNIFFCSALKAMNKLELNSVKSTVEIKALELLFSKNVSSFSTKMICHDVYDKCGDLIFERIHLCKYLKSLDIQYSINPSCIEIFLSSLTRLQNLRTINMVPESKQSFHMVIPVISKHCRLLEEVTVVYNSELLSEIGNIGSLEMCKKIRKLILYSFGKGSEAEYIVQLLYKLKNLKYFFHRELPHAIIDIHLKCCQRNINVVFNLRVLLLAMYCKGVGSQLCYLPDDSLVQIGSICPYISHMKLVRPSNLSVIAHSISSLRSLQIHDCNIKESFMMCVDNDSLKCLASISLKNIEYIDYGCLLLISKCCPQLIELEITHSNIFWSNDLNESSKPSFPQLKKLTLQKIPCTEQTDPNFVYPHTLIIDKFLLKYLLFGTTNLEELYLEFDADGTQSIGRNEIPNEKELTLLISECKGLKDLMLLSCPNVTYKMLNSIICSCSKIQHLWDIDLWKISSSEMDKILRYFSHLFFQSYER